jgi:hypothetical protein
MIEDKTQERKPIAWADDGLICYIDGYGWSSVVLDGHVEHICLGKEEEVKAILAGDKPITEVSSLLCQRAFQRIFRLRRGSEDGGATEVRGRGPIRGRSIGVTRHRQKDAGRPKARQRISRR